MNQATSKTVLAMIAAIVLALVGGGVAYLTGILGADETMEPVSVEPGDIPGTLMYTAYDGEQVLARINADGTEQRDLTSRYASTPERGGMAWSPDGEWIAYFDAEEDSRDTEAGISLVSADGEETRSVDMESVHGTMRLETRLNWSHDGEWLAFAYQEEDMGASRVGIVEPDRGELKSVQPGTDMDVWSDSGPVWAPDVAELAFVRTDGSGQRSILHIGDDLEDPGPVIEDDPRAHRPAWSPDGESIVSSGSTDDGERSNLHVADIESRDPKNITGHERWDFSPTWSSRDRIAFMSDQGDRDFDIFLVEPDGGDLRNITEDYDLIASIPDWSDDGRYLTFSAQYEDEERYAIMVYDSEADELYTVLERERPLYHAQWRPESG